MNSWNVSYPQGEQVGVIVDLTSADLYKGSVHRKKATAMICVAVLQWSDDVIENNRHHNALRKINISKNKLSV